MEIHVRNEWFRIFFYSFLHLEKYPIKVQQFDLYFVWCKMSLCTWLLNQAWNKEYMIKSSIIKVYLVFGKRQRIKVKNEHHQERTTFQSKKIIFACEKSAVLCKNWFYWVQSLHTVPVFTIISFKSNTF